MMERNDSRSDDVLGLEQRLTEASANRSLDCDVDVSEIRRRLTIRRRRRRVTAGGLAVTTVAVLLVMVSRFPQRIDVVDRSLAVEVRAQDPAGANASVSESDSRTELDTEQERLAAAAEAARVYAEEFQAKLDAIKRERELRLQEVAVAKLIREQARQEYLLSLAKSGERVASE